MPAMGIALSIAISPSALAPSMADQLNWPCLPPPPSQGHLPPPSQGHLSTVAESRVFTVDEPRASTAAIGLSTCFGNIFAIFNSREVMEVMKGMEAIKDIEVIEGIEVMKGMEVIEGMEIMEGMEPTKCMAGMELKHSHSNPRVNFYNFSNLCKKRIFRREGWWERRWGERALGVRAQ